MVIDDDRQLEKNVSEDLAAWDDVMRHLLKILNQSRTGLQSRSMLTLPIHVPRFRDLDFPSFRQNRLDSLEPSSPISLSCVI